MSMAKTINYEVIIRILFILSVFILGIVLSELDFLGVKTSTRNLSQWALEMRDNCSLHGGELVGSGISMRCRVNYVDEDGFMNTYYWIYDIEKGWYKLRK